MPCTEYFLNSISEPSDGRMVRNLVESYHDGDIPNSMKTVQIDGCLPKIAFETDRYVQPSEPEEYVLGIDGKTVLVGEDESEVCGWRAAASARAGRSGTRARFC